LNYTRSSPTSIPVAHRFQGKSTTCHIHRDLA